MGGTDGEPAVGEELGAYRLENRLGEGAMGVVFQARDLRSDELVAVKVLRRALVDSDEYRRRFVREQRAMAAATSRHLLTVRDRGEVNGRPFLVTAFLPGGSLADRLSSGPLPLADTLRVTSELAAGLDELHRHEVIHRDIKPSNVLFDAAGGAVLGDFGLARSRDDSVLTRSGQVMGTVEYLAPELVVGQAASPASDVYALGCLVYECIAGLSPFGGRPMMQIALGHLREAPRDPCAGDPRYPPQLGIALLTALAKSPVERPRTAVALARLLSMAGRGAGV